MSRRPHKGAAHFFVSKIHGKVFVMAASVNRLGVQAAKAIEQQAAGFSQAIFRATAESASLRPLPLRHPPISTVGRHLNPALTRLDAVTFQAWGHFAVAKQILPHLNDRTAPSRMHSLPAVEKNLLDLGTRAAWKSIEEAAKVVAMEYSPREQETIVELIRSGEYVSMRM